jgi:hypothetical protein
LTLYDYKDAVFTTIEFVLLREVLFSLLIRPRDAAEVIVFAVLGLYVIACAVLWYDLLVVCRFISSGMVNGIVDFLRINFF